MNKTNLDLLTSVYQNCRTAITSIDDIIDEVQNKGLIKELKEQRDNYCRFAELTESIAKENGVQELDNNSLMERAKLWTSIKMATLLDKSTRHIAQMLLIGTVMGTLQCYKDLYDYKSADKPLLELCGDLLKMEEKHFDFLKTFLKNLQN